MMEDRKKVEIEYYDRRANYFSQSASGLGFLALGSYEFLYQLLKENCQNKIVLDYGSGFGSHSIEIAKMEAKKVIGIDLSEESLKVAAKMAEKEKIGDRVEFLKMDCEKMEFPDNSFDVIFDGGTFSSIDLKLALPELARVLKKEGVLIGIETFGHNPFTNFKRKLNRFLGKRTGWATEHILKLNDFTEIKKYFFQVSIYYFHLISWLAFPFMSLPGGKMLLKLMESVDRILLQIPFFKKYAFKVVFIFSRPRK